MVDQHIYDEILQFKAALGRRPDASDSEESIGGAGSNRGRKLKRRARTVHEGQLSVPYGDGYQPEIVQYANKRRAVIKLKSPRRHVDSSDNEEPEEEDEEYSADDEDDPYAAIDLEAILTPIGHPSELPSHPGISKVYTRTTLSTLARRALDLICTEQKQVSQINRLLAAFLGDNPSYIREHNLHLPEWLDNGGENFSGIVEFASGTSDVSMGKSNGSKESAVDEDDSDKKSVAHSEHTGNDHDSDTDSKFQVTRRVTRNQTTNELEPFFTIPKLDMDRDFGFPADTAQETRQLAQIAAQRGEEFIGSLYKIRSGLLRADRFRAKVYKWCREVGGDISEEDEVVKNS
ncbi:RXT2-like protein [Limtongia smithiae]|uniref:RXT2-like protein n=1 Tax=Limtongia smithiae TaxID=1125753 RepID=UPI0034CD4D94